MLRVLVDVRPIREPFVQEWYRRLYDEAEQLARPELKIRRHFASMGKMPSAVHQYQANANLAQSEGCNVLVSEHLIRRTHGPLRRRSQSRCSSQGFLR